MSFFHSVYLGKVGEVGELGELGELGEFGEFGQVIFSVVQDRKS